MSDEPDWLRLWIYARRVAFSILQSFEASEDAASHALEQLLSAMRQGAVDNPEAWLIRAVKRRSIDQIRRAQRDRQLTRNLTTRLDRDGVMQEWLSSQRLLDLSAHVDALPEVQRRVLREVANGLSMHEVAAELDLSVRAAESHLYRARMKLRAAILAGLGVLLGWLRRPRAPRVATALALVTASALVLTPMIGHSPDAGADPDRCTSCPSPALLAPTIRPASERRPPAAPSVARPAAKPAPSRRGMVVERHDVVIIKTPVGPVGAYQEHSPDLPDTYLGTVRWCLEHFTLDLHIGIGCSPSFPQEP